MRVSSVSELMKMIYKKQASEITEFDFDLDKEKNQAWQSIALGVIECPNLKKIKFSGFAATPMLKALSPGLRACQQLEELDFSKMYPDMSKSGGIAWAQVLASSPSLKICKTNWETVSIFTIYNRDHQIDQYLSKCNSLQTLECHRISLSMEKNVVENMENVCKLFSYFPSLIKYKLTVIAPLAPDQRRILFLGLEQLSNALEIELRDCDQNKDVNDYAENSVMNLSPEERVTLLKIAECNREKAQTTFLMGIKLKYASISKRFDFNAPDPLPAEYCNPKTFMPLLFEFAFQGYRQPEETASTRAIPINNNVDNAANISGAPSNLPVALDLVGDGDVKMNDENLRLTFSDASSEHASATAPDHSVFAQISQLALSKN